MSVIPCERDPVNRKRIQEYAEALKIHAHNIGEHGLDEQSFYGSGLFRGAIELIRGEYSATMRDKRAFAQNVLSDRSRAWNERPWRASGYGRLSGVNEVPEDVALLELEGRDGRQDPLDETTPMF